MLAGYVDAAYSDNVETARSTTGWLLKYGGAAVTHVFTEVNLSQSRGQIVKLMVQLMRGDICVNF